MLILNAKTKISAILKQQPDALEAIISISPKFEKLRNPLLRKLMAGRASVGMASKIAGCSIQDFYNKLTPLGFHVDASTATEDKNDNTLVDDGEDTGIDGVRDSGEPNFDSALNPDPSNDNYRFTLTQDPDYSNINGTEGNAVSIDLGRFPDSEDLNGKKIFNSKNRQSW